MKPKYIYLDWNIFKEVKDNPNGEFSLKLEQLKKKFKIPYSFAHLCDLQKNCNEANRALIESDVEFIKKFTEGYIIGFDKDDYMLSNKINIYEKFNEVYTFNVFDAKTSLSGKELEQILDEIEERGFENFIKSGNEHLFPQIMKTALGRFQANYRLYKIHREFMIDKIRNDNEAVYKSLTEVPLNEERFKNSVIEFMKSGEIKGGFLQTIGISYSLLDYNPEFKEKVTSKSNFPNIYNDGEHLRAAINAEMYITRDKSTLKKSRFIFNTYGINTPIYDLEEFLKCD